MAFGKGRNKVTVAELASAPEPRAVIGSAVQVTVKDAGWNLNQYGDGTWQNDAWNFYNDTPELHNTADYIGAACSLVRLYVCEVDEYGQPQGEVGAPSTKKDGQETNNSDPAIGALSSQLFGGPGAKAEILRALGVSLTVAGETYLIGQGSVTRGRDKWYTVAPSQIRQISDTEVSIAVGNGRYETLHIGSSANMITRIWTPHPELMFRADSPTRGVLIPLRQQRELVRFLSSQLVSRLASASLLPVPSEIDFPKTDLHPGGWEGVIQQLYEVITSNLQGAGTAAMIAPILMPMGSDALAAMANIEPIVFESILSSQAIDLRKELRETIAVGLNVPMEIQLGGREMNHWSIWWANEEFIIKTIAPLMGRICDALTTSYLIPALRNMGKDPSRYMFWYDTAPLANSANRLVDAKDLNVLGIVSDAAVRVAGAFHESDAMSREEKDQRFLRELVLRDPTLFQLESVRKEMGIDIPDFMPEPTVAELEADGPPAPPRPDRGLSSPAIGAAPDASASDSELIASLTARPSAVLVGADAVVRRALELAGKRLLTNSTRGMWSDVPAYELHTKVRVANDLHAGTLLASAWDHVPDIFASLDVDVDHLRVQLDKYAKGLLTSSLQHNQTLLAAFLDSAGIR
jgi:hypothetical protein